MNHNSNYELCLIIYQYSDLNCSKCNTLLTDINKGKLSVERKYIVSIISPFLSKSKTDRKIKYLFFKVENIYHIPQSRVREIDSRERHGQTRMNVQVN